MKNKSRLFTFGCSFSKYAWPMYPEILGQSFDEVYNFGSPGTGNFYIYHRSLIELLSNNITDSDFVIVQWSEPARFDYIETDEGNWKNLGIESAEQLVRAKLDSYISNETIVYKQLFYMYSLIKILEEKKCNWIFLFLNSSSIVHNDSYYKKLNFIGDIFYDYEYLKTNVLKFKHNFVDEISMEDYFKKVNMPILTVRVDNKIINKDSHPLPKYTLAYLKEYVFNKIEMLNTKKIEEYVLESHKILDKHKIIDFRTIKVNTFHIDNFNKTSYQLRKNE